MKLSIKNIILAFLLFVLIHSFVCPMVLDAQNSNLPKDYKIAVTLLVAIFNIIWLVIFTYMMYDITYYSYNAGFTCARIERTGHSNSIKL